MSAEIRRNAVRKYGRGRATAFFLGYFCLIAFFFMAGAVRNTAIDVIGESIWLWFFFIFGFASFLIPQCLVLSFATQDALLYCPQCRNFLGSIGALLKLNKESKCNRCGCEIEIAPIDKRQARFDVAYIFGGLWTMVGVSFVILKLFLALFPPAG